MENRATLLLYCQDRKGLVFVISRFLLQHGANILHADQHNDAELGLFFIRIQWSLAGFDCAVSKYALFPSTDPTKDVVEMACSNRPDGGVGIFPGHGPAHVYDCLRAQDEGYKCSYTPIEALYPHLNAELKAKNKGGCVVASARPFAHGDDGSDFVEVGCADGGPGWVLVYPAGASSPSELRNCVEVANLAGGCQIPTNRKKS